MWFEDNKAKLNINMSGKDYIDWQESKKWKIPKKLIRSLPFLLGSLAGIIFLCFYVPGLGEQEPIKPIFEGWYEEAPRMVAFDWNTIAKISFVWCAPFLFVVVCISWLIHGVGFHLVK